MIFALKVTLVFHSGLQSVMLFIFHMFHVRTDLFSLSLCARNHLQFVSIHILLSHPTSLSNFNMNANGHTMHTKAYVRSHTKHCKHAHMMYTHSSLNPSILFFFSFPHLVCSFSLRFSLHCSAACTINVLHILQTSQETHTSTNTQGSWVGGGHGCSSSAQSQSGSRGLAASCLPASPGGIHSN